jgi:recombination protein RecT
MGLPAQKQTKYTQVVSLVEKNKLQVHRGTPQGKSADRLTRIFLNTIRKNEDLLKCEPMSLFGAFMESVSLGLELDVLGQAYLIPRRDKKKGIFECQFLIGFQGLIDLAIRSDKVSSVDAQIVCELDRFEFSLGTDQFIRHFYDLLQDRGRMIGAYATATMADGTKKFEVLNMDDIKKARESAQTDYIWKEHEHEMAKKTAVRKLAKYLPMATEASRVAKADEYRDAGLDVSYSDAYKMADPPPITVTPAQQTQSRVEDLKKDLKSKKEKNQPPKQDPPPALTMIDCPKVEGQVAADLCDDCDSRVLDGVACPSWGDSAS